MVAMGGQKIQYGPYLIIVIFGTPPYFLGLKKVRQKKHKFATKIVSRQNSENQYFCMQIHISF